MLLEKEEQKPQPPKIGSFPEITEAGLDDLRRRIGVKIGDTAEPWCYEATRDNIRHYAHGIGDDNPLWCDPDYAATTKLRRHHRVAQLSVQHQPHHFRLRRRTAGRARDVVGRRLDWHKQCSSQRRDFDRSMAEGTGRASDALCRACDSADLSREFFQSGRRHGSRSRQLVFPHRARSRTRAGHQVQGRQSPRAASLHR